MSKYNEEGFAYLRESLAIIKILHTSNMDPEKKRIELLRLLDGMPPDKEIARTREILTDLDPKNNTP